MSQPDTPTKTMSDFEARLDKADTTVANFGRDDDGAIVRLKHILHIYPTIIPAIILLLSVLGFGLIATNFMSASTLTLILKQVTITGIIAIAQTIIILTAGIDLSVGAILVLSSMVIGKCAVEWGVPVPLAVACGLFVATAMGTLNGLLITRLKLPPFIVTLGTLSIFTSLKLWYTGSQSIRNADITEKAPQLLWFGHTVPGTTLIYGVIAFVLLALLVWYQLNRTAWGRHVHAIGDDPDAAMLAGIRVDRTLVSVYGLAGLICGFGGLVAIGRVGSASPIGFETINLDSITAVVIGGTSLFGGRGSIAGSVLGAIIVGVFNTGLSLAGVDDYWKMFAAGVLVITAVALDQWLRRASQ